MYHTTKKIFQKPEEEKEHKILKNGKVQKKSFIQVACEISFFEQVHGAQKNLIINGVAVATKDRKSNKCVLRRG